MILASGSIKRSLVGLAIVSAALAGCGPKHTPTVPVTGKVTFKGQPVEGASVAFFLDGSGTPAVGTTKSDGTFDLTSHEPGDGAQEGQHKVTVTKVESNAPAVPAGESMEAALKRGQTKVTETMALPPDYADAGKTTLSFSVKKGEKNHFDIELK